MNAPLFDSPIWNCARLNGSYNRPQCIDYRVSGFLVHALAPLYEAIGIRRTLLDRSHIRQPIVT